VIYCINPFCSNRQNPDSENLCQECGTSLFIDNRYCLLKPVRPLNSNHYTDVFEGVDVSTDERKILKVLKKSDPKLLELFEREASVLSSLDCSGIPKVGLDFYFEITPINATFPLHCIVMEKVEGQNLEQWIHENGRLSARQAHSWLTQLTKILDCVHKASYFHRDIKPSNIILRPDGNLVLIDFGTVRDSSSATYLAKISSQENVTGMAEASDITIFQSSGFTPPEQLNGKALPQSDFYALGRTFIHLMTGIVPFSLPEDEDTGRLVWRKGLDIHKSFANLIDWMTDPDPSNRPKSTRIILHELKQRKPRSSLVRRALKSPSVWVAGIGLVGLFSWVGYNSLNFVKSTVSTVFTGMGDQGLRLTTPDDAKGDYQNALWWNPKNGEAYYKLGIICRDQQDNGCATKNFTKALEVGLSDDWTEYLNVGEWFDERGDYSKAETLYQISKSKAGAEAGRPLNNLSRLRNLQGRSNEAIALAEEGLKTKGLMEDTLGALYKNKAWAYINKHEPAKAIPLLQKSISTYPDRADIYCLESQAKASLNRPIDKNNELSKCYNNKSEAPEVQQMRHELIERLLLRK
jgi:Tfp pilus assembly protein PilF